LIQNQGAQVEAWTNSCFNASIRNNELLSYTAVGPADKNVLSLQNVSRI